MTLRRSALVVAQLLAIAVILWLASKDALGNWDEVSAIAVSLRPNWGLLFASTLIVFSAYLLLIEAWRRLMRDWGTHVRYRTAAHIWFVSVMGRYLPGRVWSAIAVGLMAQRAGVAPAPAVGGALLLTLINVVVGCCSLVAIGGPELVTETLFQARQGDETVSPWLTGAVIGIPLLIVLTLPLTITPLASVVRRITKRNFELPTVRWTGILRSAVACAGAWLLYGLAFRVFYLGLFGSTAGSLIDFVKVYTGSYLVGYMAVFVPGGFGARELVMQKLMPFYGLSSAEAGFVAAWYSRVWLTVLEIFPGVTLLLIRPKKKGVQQADTPPAAP